MEGKTPYNKLLCICLSSTLTNLGITVVLRIEQIVIPACWSIGVTLVLKLSKINLYYHFRLFSSSPIIYKRQVDGRSGWDSTSNARRRGEKKGRKKERKLAVLVIISLFQALVIFVTSTVLSLCHSSPAPLSSSPPLLTETATHHICARDYEAQGIESGSRPHLHICLWPPLFPHGAPKDTPNPPPPCYIK